jgi:GAF domain-containing protein
VIGAIIIYRKEVRPFTDKQVDLVKNFAAQAVIGVENARLLGELRQRTDDLGRSVEELRALGEVSHAVNSTLDLENVLSTIVAKAAQLSITEAGAIYVFDNAQREFYLRATYGMDRELIEALTQHHIGLDEPNGIPPEVREKMFNPFFTTKPAGEGTVPWPVHHSRHHREATFGVYRDRYAAR